MQIENIPEVKELLTRVKKHFSPENEHRIIKALEYATIKHEGQTRESSGVPYIVHPVSVALILMDYGIDADTIVSALLHDVLEDTDTKRSELKTMFGSEVAELVDGVSRVKTLRYKSSENENSESLRKMFVAMAKDIRVIMIKLADRLNNMRTLENMPNEHQVRKSLDTRDVYIPIAERLGFGKIKGELEDICFKYLYPDEEKEISNMLDKFSAKHQQNLENVNTELKSMVAELGIEGEVYSRIKRKYSVYKKKLAKGIESIYDLLAHRIIVPSIKDCYLVLGEIHNRWKPVPGRIKDYVAAPKKNGYQSLHTTLLMEDGMPFEVQIRTREMHKVCEFGLAAHWQYKNKIEKSSDLDKKLAFLRELLEESSEIADTKTFLSIAKTDFYTNEIFVFTPKNKVIQLVENSTPIDFAYAIHSDLGNKCVGAKINGRLCGLTTKLKTGDIVEIVTSPVSKGPSRDWLKLAKTSGARTKIKSFFKKEMKEENIKLGKDMLEIEAKRKNINLSEILSNAQAVEKMLVNKSFLDIEDVYASIGYGGVTASAILTQLISETNSVKKRNNKKITPIKSGDKHNPGIVVKGVDGVFVRLAGCCSPIPSDDIIGFVSQGNGVAVHRADCPNVKKLNGERLIKVEWDKSKKVTSFQATICIIATDRAMLVSDITMALGAITSISITGINAVKVKENAKISITIVASNINQVNEVIKKLETIDSVKNVFRK